MRARSFVRGYGSLAVLLELARSEPWSVAGSVEDLFGGAVREDSENNEVFGFAPHRHAVPLRGLDSN
jgi:hypothetical protein